MKKIFSLLFVLTTLTLTVNAQNESTDNPNAAAFKFEQTEHDFGTLDEGPKVTHVFNFTNTGKEPLIITKSLILKMYKNLTNYQEHLFRL